MQRITIPAIACCAALAAAAADFGHFPSTAHIIPFCGAIALTDGCSSLTPSAAQQIADAIAQQMYEEFRQGRGVKFGNYFYARLYLDGTSDSDGKLTSANSINVRFVSGAGFKLTRAFPSPRPVSASTSARPTRSLTVRSTPSSSRWWTRRANRRRSQRPRAGTPSES